MYLLDTQVICELRKPHADRHVIHWASSVAASSLYLSAISALELETGVLRAERSNAQQGAALRAWLVTQVLPAFYERVLEVDTAVAIRCAQLRLLDKMAYGDALIATTALVHGLTVVTRNTSDFEPAGVKLFNPWLGKT